MNTNDLALFENVVAIAYTSTDQNERQKASDYVNTFALVDYWKHNLMLLKQSKNGFVLHFAATALRNSVTDFINTFTPQDRAEIRSTLLAVLADLGDQFWGSNTVRPILVDCFCRLQKLCWFDSTGGPSVTLIGDVMPFLRHSLAHSIVGINILQQLVREMSDISPKIPYSTQRKIAVLFREKCLHEIFKLGLQSLQRLYQLSSPTTAVAVSSPTKESVVDDATFHKVLAKETLELISQALSFDFIGTSPDNTSDDIGVIHVPEAWAPIFEERDTVSLIAGIYEKYGAPQSTQCLEILEKFSGVRSSLFRNSDTRSVFLNLLIDSLGNILTTKKDLDNIQNIHQITRLLVRFKGNYQLKHVLETKNYTAFIHKVAEFTISTYQTQSFHAIFYLFSFWSRMVAAECLLKSEKGTPTHLKEIIPALIKTFIAVQLEQTKDPPSDDPLESEHLQSVLGEIIGMSRVAYKEVATMILSDFFRVAQTAQSHFQQQPPPTSPTAPSSPTPTSPPIPTSPQQQLLQVVENQLAWMVYFTTSIMGGKNGTGVRYIGTIMNEEGMDEEQNIEGQLLCSLWECLSMHDKRLHIQGPTKATPHLELAFVTFLQKFCRLYLNENNVGSSTGVYEMLTRVDLGDSNRVIERIVQKVIMLVKMWQHDEIIEETLGTNGLFWSLANGYGSSKLMGKSPLVSHLLEHHAEVDIPYIKGAMRTRVSFYKTLSRLLFGINSTTDFYVFILPFQRSIDQIKHSINTQQQLPIALKTLVCVLSDLQGVVSAIFTKDRGYIQFFNWIYHDTGYYEWFAQLLAQYKQLALEAEHCWAIIKFADELASNQQRRICFPLTSADGIRLFRTTAQILIHFAKFNVSADHPPKMDDKYKSFKLYLRCLLKCLTGGYTNFGVFEMYNDPIVTDLLKTSCTLIFNLDSTLLELYPKVFTLVFSVLGTLAVNHSSFLLALDPPLFGQLLRILLRGLQSTVKDIISESCSALDKLFSLQVSHILLAQQNRLVPQSPAYYQLELMTTYQSKFQKLYTVILLQLLNLIITLESVHWFVSKPLLALIFVCQNDFAFVQQLVISSQSQDEARASKVAALFAGLMKDIKINLDTENREKFTSNVTAFRVEMKSIIDLNAFYKVIVQFSAE